ncbi:MAG: ABC transporter permease [Polyangia bacterium]
MEVQAQGQQVAEAPVEARAAAVVPVEAPPTIVIKASRGWVALKVRELWDYRELLFFLAWRDVKVRYKQTFFGVAWAIMQPFMTMVVFSLVFGRLAHLPSDGVPYPVFAFAALLPWQLFANSLNASSQSLVASQSLIKKVYFPRLVIPVASVLEGVVDFCVAFAILVAMMAFYGIAPTWKVVFLPLLLLLALATSLAVGLWLSALNVKYRDVRYTLPFLTQLWLFSTPIAYSSSLVPERWRALYGLNPMAGVVEGFRWALLGREAPLGRAFFVSIGVVAVVMLTGLAYFRRMERTFADVV